MRDVFDVVRDLDKTGPDGSAQTNQTAVENICLCHGLIWRKAKTGSDEISMKSSGLYCQRRSLQSLH